MSRSYKKKPIIKDKPTSGKRLGNKKFRRKTKQLTKKKDVDFEEVLFLEDKSEVINDYDVSDYKFDVNWINSRKVKGKKKRLIK